MSSVVYSRLSILPEVDRVESTDTDFEDDSEVEDLSPRISLGSTKRKSDTTISSLNELHTPNLDSNGLCKLNFDVNKYQSVKGPRGPHLFRGSVGSSSIATEPDAIENYYLNMSSAMPTHTDFHDYYRPMMEVSSQQQENHFFDSSMGRIDSTNLGDVLWWTPRQVASWMYHVGLDLLIAEKFEKNDISGAILLTLKYEDILELGIPSFGLRTKVWNEVIHLRCNSSRPIENLSPLNESVKSTDKQLLTLSRRNKCHKKQESCRLATNPAINYFDIISSSISISNSGNENLIVKEKKDTESDNYSNEKEQQILDDSFCPKSDPGILEKSPLVENHDGKEMSASPDVFRALSSANKPSKIDDSKVEETKSQKILSQLAEANLRLLHFRDPQENVKQFIESQFLNLQSNTTKCPHETAIKELKIQSPEFEDSNTCMAPPRVLDCVFSPSITFSPHEMERVVAISPELQNDVQSSMTHNHLERYSSKTNISLSIMHPELGTVARKFCHSVLKNFIKSSPHISHVCYPSPNKALPPNVEDNIVGATNNASDLVTQAGWMKKRKTKILHFDWHNYYFSLKGTQLAMYKQECLLNAIDYIDIDDYAIVCSSFATGSKLHAAFKAMSLSREKDKDRNIAPFAFQLVPASVRKGNYSDKFRRIKAHHFAVHSQTERSDWMREMMLAKAMQKKNQGYKINVNGNVK